MVNQKEPAMVGKYWGLMVCLSFTSLYVQGQSVTVQQLLSQKGMSCDVDNSHLLHLTMGAVAYDEGFTYQFMPSKQTLKVKGVNYTGIQAAEVLKSVNGQQLALGVNVERFGLYVNRVALNVVSSPYESVGYYWVAEGSPAKNRAALNALFGQGSWQDYVSTTGAGNTRVSCTIAG